MKDIQANPSEKNECMSLQEFLTIDTNNITHLTLYNLRRGFDLSAVQGLNQKFIGCISLTHVRIKKVLIEHEVFDKFLISLKTLPNLTDLELYLIRIHYDEEVTLNEKLLNYNEYWKNLDLTFNPHLETLNLYGSYFGSENTKKLAECLRGSSCLTDLGLGSNFIGKQGVEALAGLLTSGVPLASLNLSSNWTKVREATALFKALKNNNTLTHLNLKDCQIGDGGVIELANILPSNCTLFSLNLFNANETSVGVKALEQALHMNITITEVVFGYLIFNEAPDPLSDEGVMKERALAGVERSLTRNKTMFGKVHASLQDVINCDNLNEFPPCWQLKYYQKVNPIIFSCPPEGLSPIENLCKVDRLIATNFFSLTGICKSIYISSFFPKEILLKISSYLYLHDVNLHPKAAFLDTALTLDATLLAGEDGAGVLDLLGDGA